MGLIAVQIFFRRLLLALPIVLCVSALVFVILRLLPADPSACRFHLGRRLRISNG